MNANPEVWLQKYNDILLKFAISKVDDDVLAEDLVQETYLSAFKSLDSFRGDSSEVTWLTGILKFKIADFYRHGYKFQYHDEDVLETIDNLSSEDNSVKELSIPEQDVDQLRINGAMSSCIRKLPQKMQRAYVLKEKDGLDGAAISKLLNISESNVWTTLSRARDKLHACMTTNCIAT